MDHENKIDAWLDLEDEFDEWYEQMLNEKKEEKQKEIIEITFECAKKGNV
jgi:hypothetical protein